ncbi:MAG: hypothetical protein Q8O19_03865, partial [Rectinemataceae bacterium]|nr:hypothetical protein [Rectinemataceae bacterium]
RPILVSGPSIEEDVAAFMEEAKTAAKSISRQGFRATDLMEDGVREGFVIAVPLVVDVTRQIGSFIECMKNVSLPEGTWSRQFVQDSAVFTSCFRKIYGVAA